MTSVEQIIARQEESFEKLTDKYIKHAGEWHNEDCDFPTIDRAVCNCNLSKNKKTIKDFYRSSIKEILEGVKQREIEEMDKYEPAYEDIDIGYVNSKSDTINYLSEIIKNYEIHTQL